MTGACALFVSTTCLAYSSGYGVATLRRGDDTLAAGKEMCSGKRLSLRYVYGIYETL